MAFQPTSTEPILLPSSTRGFGRLPESAASISRRPVTMAIWSGSTDGVDELVGEADDERHVVSIALTRYWCESVADGRSRRQGRWSPGGVQLMEAGVHPRGVFTGPWKLLHLYLPHATVADALEVEPRRLELIDPSGEPDRELAGTGLALAREVAAQDRTSRLHIEALSLAMIGHLGRRWSNLARAPRARGGLAPWQLKRVCEAMTADVSRDVGLRDLAAVVGVSPTHLSRAFKQSTGVAPFRWLQERRIEKAQALLEATDMALAEIALAVGFSAQPQFTTAFSRLTGSTPGVWRRERRL